MKVTNWRKKIVAAIVAGGALVPTTSYAVNITIPDSGFDKYVVPSRGYAYATGAYETYRPGDNTGSPWVDDLDSPTSPGGNTHTQDDTHSNWIYNTTYSNYAGSTQHYRGAPRSNEQAMHGADHYNAQRLTNTFASEKYYTLSVWAQGDADADPDNDRVYLYLFNGAQSFNESTSLAVKTFQGGSGADFNIRASSAEGPSRTNWRKISVGHAVFPDSSEVGQQIGVGFYMNHDAAIDDVSLIEDDAANHILVLEVNTTNGQVRVRNQTSTKTNLDYYQISSAAGALNAGTWNSLHDQNLAGFPSGNGSGNGWEEAGGSGPNAIGESYLLGNSAISAGTNIGLGAAFNVGGTHDLYFQYGSLAHPLGDYNDDGVVNAADYIVWRKTLGQNITLPNSAGSGTVSQLDYDIWRQHFGEVIDPNSSTLSRGLVHYVTSFSGTSLDGATSVPEPACVTLVGMGLVGTLTVRRKRNS